MVQLCGKRIHFRHGHGQGEFLLAYGGATWFHKDVMTSVWDGDNMDHV